MPPATPSSPRLATALARGGISTAIGVWGRFVLQFGTVIIVARIIGPVEYGFAAIVLVFSSISELLRGSGLASAVLQRRDLTDAIASRVHFISCTIGAVLGIALIAAAPAVGSLIGDQRVATYSPALAAVLVCAGIAAVPTALFSRNLRFHALAAIDFGAAALGCAVAVALAVTGWGAASLVWQAVAVTAVQCGAVLIAGRWRPTRPAPREAARPYVSFGLNAAITQTARYVSQNLDRVLLGAAGTSAAVGVYAQAMQLIQLPVAQLSAPLQRVIIPGLSRLQGESKRYRNYFRRVLALFTLVLWPVLALVALLAPEIIGILFGEAWLASAGLMRLLLGVGFAAPLVFAASWVFVSTGNARAQSALTVGIAAFTIPAILLGLQHGAGGMAVAVSAASLASTVPALVLACRRSPLRAGDVLRPLLWPAVVTVLAAGAAALAISFAETPLVRLLLGGGVAMAVAGAAIAGIPPIRASALSLLALVRKRNPDSD